MLFNFNSVFFRIAQNHKLASEGFTICTHTTSLVPGPWNVGLDVKLRDCESADMDVIPEEVGLVQPHW